LGRIFDLLRLRNLDVFYRDLQVLYGASINVQQHQFVYVIGSNGAGKSTLVKSISGIVKPTSGEILFKDINILDLTPQRIIELGIVQIPEGRKIFNNLTVIENLELGSYLRRAKAQRKTTLHYVFALFPRLSERKGQLAGTLSGGEQQMLAIARGLMALPELLILDEPSLGLAPIIVAEIFEIIHELKRKGTTILIIEQNVRKALAFSDKCYVLENGRIVLEETPDKILDNEHVVKAYLGI
jgi:branched-chain amino acid transport system ATP-binding protein